MEKTKNQIVELVHRTVDELNEELEPGANILTERETVLYGRGASIDSMTLVSLIVAVEENIRTEMDLSITLANEKAMSMERSPFKTLGALTDYVLEVVEEARDA